MEFKLVDTSLNQLNILNTMSSTKVSSDLKWIWMGSLQRIECQMCVKTGLTTVSCPVCSDQIKSSNTMYQVPHKGPIQLFPPIDAQNSKCILDLNKFSCDNNSRMKEFGVFDAAKTEIFRIYFNESDFINSLDAKNHVSMIISDKYVIPITLDSTFTSDIKPVFEFNFDRMILVITWLGLKWTFDIPKDTNSNGVGTVQPFKMTPYTIQTTVLRDDFLRVYTTDNVNVVKAC